MRNNTLLNDINLEIIDVLRFERKTTAYNTIKTSKRSFSAISFRLRGNAEFMYNNKITPASPTKCIYIPANIDYSQKGSDEEIICVHFKSDKNLFDKIISFDISYSQMMEHFLVLNDLWMKKNPGYIFKCKSILYDILYSLYKTSDKDRALNAQQLIFASVEYMQTDFCKMDFSLSKAISLSNMSEAYFRRIFKAVYKMTPIKYIRTLKISHAKALLQNGSYSAYQISQMCGFAEEKYFYTVFKKITGQTPAEWKNTN